MRSQNVEALGQALPGVPLALNTLPSEIRKLIVSYLAPDPKHLRPGCKRHLKNANLAHSCLREWVTEYMFRDMALIQVLPGISTHLEFFAVSRENASLLKYVKHIAVQVSPAIRWEIGTENPFALHLEEITRQRLCQRFKVKSVRQMTDEQEEYCSQYHRAMVEPFTDNRRWHQLLRTANASWGKIFRHFTHLEEISVGCCEIVDQPRPTYTNLFLLQHGKFVEADAHPRYIEDPTVNMAWASSIICGSAPPTVRFLRLSMANMDNFSSVATVNRLLSLGYRAIDSRQSLSQVTRLDLSLCGVAGTHGDRDWHGDTGSAGNVRFWTKALNSMYNIQYLALRNKLSTDENIRFSPRNYSDPKGCLLEWLLPGLVGDYLSTLRLCDFLLDKASIHTTLSGRWPRLENLVLDDAQLMLRENEAVDTFTVHIEHLQGYSWLEVCQALSEKSPDVRIELNRPVSNVNDREDHRLHPKCISLLQSSPNVVLNVTGPYGSMVKPPTDESYGLQPPLLPDVPTTII